jgi:hypothetical protein
MYRQLWTGPASLPDGGLIVVTGSIYIVGEAMRTLRPHLRINVARILLSAKIWA